ncbi:probable glycosyltransferase At5g03795 isoform X1 [Hevea brasiliensis]|uniref:probable glycosyltransferase At5g03795 isoform X1 n=1 Tax=Hevea brasiliensis TaxID=3981 RepID=UPI0025DB96F4|nr:probable glycosyltransferase At5g03795 isoform X1 [Hevea brasiliensis]
MQTDPPRKPLLRCPPLFFYSILCITLSLILPYVYSQRESFSFEFFGPLEPEISDEVFHSPEAFKKDYFEMEKNLKIFLYPDCFENGHLSDHTEKPSGRYASESYFFKNILEGQFLTKDPNEAHLFFIPFSCLKLRRENFIQGRSYLNISATVDDFVQSLISKYPYWNRTLGADHFVVICHDIGLVATEQVPLLVKNSIRVVCSPIYGSEYIPHKDVSFPQIFMPLPTLYEKHGDHIHNRNILGFWAGRRNSNIRDTLVRLWQNDNELNIQHNFINRAHKGHFKYQEKFYRSKFCMCPRGSSINGGRISLAIHYGCVPVILSDYLDLPFSDILNWQKFSVIVKEKDVNNLKKILQDIPDEEYRTLQKNTIKVQKHFQWNTPAVRLDTFHMAMYELWLRRHVIRS